jgi:hypothetical protein
MTQENAIKLIIQEIQRAETKHPTWPDDIIHATAIVGEESGELTRAALNHVYHGDKRSKIIIESIHTAASAIRLLKNLK